MKARLNIIFTVAVLVSLGIGIVIALLGCSNPPVSGTIHHKQYSAPYSWETTTMECMVRTAPDKNGFTHCTVSIPITNHHHRNASYQFCLDGVDKDGKKKSGCIEVPPSLYDSYSEGETYPR